MKTARWITLVLAIAALLTWAGVSSLRVFADGQLLAFGPRRIANPVFDTYVRPENGEQIPPGNEPGLVRFDLYGLRRDDVLLRVLAALLVSVHLILLNLDRPRVAAKATDETT